jgi:Ni/Fe-hydrogenase subunit HybB-like protein
MLALGLGLGGLVAYRWDVNLVGQLVTSGVLPQEITPLYTQYVPSVVEFVTGAGVIAYGILAFTLGVRYLKVVDHTTEPEKDVTEATRVPVTVSAD